MGSGAYVLREYRIGVCSRICKRGYQGSECPPSSRCFAPIPAMRTPPKCKGLVKPPTLQCAHGNIARLHSAVGMTRATRSKWANHLHILCDTPCPSKCLGGHPLRSPANTIGAIATSRRFSRNSARRFRQTDADCIGGKLMPIASAAKRACEPGAKLQPRD